MPYSNVDGRVDTERRVFGWEGPPGSLHHHLVPSADVSIGDELVVEATIHPGVIWLADAQEIRRQIASRYLAGVDKDVGGEQAKREDTCGEKQQQQKTIHLVVPIKSLKYKQIRQGLGGHL